MDTVTEGRPFLPCILYTYSCSVERKKTVFMSNNPMEFIGRLSPMSKANTAAGGGLCLILATKDLSDVLLTKKNLKKAF